MFIIKKTMNLIKIIISLIIIAIILYYINFNKDNDKTVSKNYEYSIIDETKECDNNKELIITENNYNYYLPCTSSETIFVLFPDGSKYNIKEAIDEYHMEIEELIDNGLKTIKEKE